MPMPAVVECRKATATVGMAPSVAPTRGMRSAKATQSASTPVNGTPNPNNEKKVTVAAMTLMSRLPAM